MARGLPHRPRAHVGLLVREVRAAAADSVVLDPEVLPLPVGQEVLEVRKRQLPADVLVELAVVEVAWVARLGAPDLARGLHVAPEEHDAPGRQDRRVHPAAGPRVRVRQAVRLEEAEADARFTQVHLVARHVAALRQPDADGVAAEAAVVVLRGDVHLSPHGLRDRVHQREEAVRGAARDHLELAGVGVLAERPEDVRAVDLAEDPAHVRELVQVEPGELVQPRLLALGALDLAPRELDEPVHVPLVARDQELVRHHRDERRRQRHRQPVLDSVLQQAVEHAHDRDVGLAQRLEEPVLLEE